MDLKSGYPYWVVKNGQMHAFPRLDADPSCGVVVVGAGITGALIADELADYGHDVFVIDQRDVCWGSTSASTALLQSVQLTTTRNHSIKAGHAVLATGYEAQDWLSQRVARNRSSYAYISDPVDRAELDWSAGTLLWESARPHLYLRSTGDGRLLAGLLRARIERCPHSLTRLFSFTRLG